MGILVTGGAGYIGSHVCVVLQEAGYDVIVVDNLSNSSEEALHRVEQITGRKLRFYPIDLLDEPQLRAVFEQESIEAVIHLAGWKAVGESVELPLKYYQNNVSGMIVLCTLMQEFGIKKLIFSSSATVYGEPKEIPITENCLKGQITNPYGQTKIMQEQILLDLAAADPEWSILLLRYFNPIGAHESGMIGEDPRGVPSNLVPYIGQVAVGKLPYLNIFGNDYDTCDGTGVRDYIHVMDLARGHLQALRKAEKGVGIYNLGTGTGYSVLEVLHAYERVCGKEIPFRICPRRPGDVASCYCDAAKAKEELQWTAEKTLDDMCKDHWRWQKHNPNGYCCEK